MLESAAVEMEQPKTEHDPWNAKAKRNASSESSQTTWKAETELPYTRRHLLPHDELRLEWQAQRDPSAGR